MSMIYPEEVMKMIPIMLDAHKISEILGISYEAALAFVKFSGIDYVKVGRSYRVSEEKLAAFLRQKGQIVIDLKDDIL